MKKPFKNEIEKLNQKLSAQENHIEKLNKKIKTQKKLVKIFFPLLILILSVIFYNKLSKVKQELEQKRQELDKLIEESYMNTIFFGAREGKSDILFTTDEEMVKKVVSVAKETLSDDYGSCFKTKPEYDVYKNCFRDISVHLHNKLEIRYGPQWFVTSGRIANCFLITPIYPKHDEYFFTIGEIYFEIFKYEQNTLQNNSTAETEEHIENDGQTDQIKRVNDNSDNSLNNIKNSDKTFNNVNENVEKVQKSN